ncbi:MAG: hypothetical protein ABSA91_02635 [Acidimicrobiales bacterium]
MSDGTGAWPNPNSWFRRRRATPGRWERAWCALAIAGVTVATGIPSAQAAPGANAGGRATALLFTTVSVSPHRALVDGQPVMVRISGGSYGTTYAVAECDPKAVLLLPEPSSSLQDGCDSRNTTVVTIGPNGSASVPVDLAAVLTTSLGAADCRRQKCFLAIFSLHSTGGVPFALQGLSFSAKACAAPGSCVTPSDAWAPSLGPSPTVGHQAVTAPPPTSAATGSGGILIKVGKPMVIALEAALAGNLTTQGSVTGPFAGQGLAGSGTSTSSASSTTANASASPSTATTSALPGQGEGLLRLTLAAPGTSWGPGTPSSTVVDAAVTDLSTHQIVGTQQFVLFWGASPFVYAGFTGAVRLSDHYSVKISVEPTAALHGLSQPGPLAPQAVLLASALEVVSPTNPQYLAYTYAPVLYGRSTSALHDVPMLSYAAVSPASGGAHLLRYVVVFSHEDGGTGYLPFLEWGTWGRMTDIDNAISFTVSAAGVISGAQYLWGGEKIGFPDSQTSTREVDRPFTGVWWGKHPVLRDATGNNQFADFGTTPFRFQLAPVAAPAPGGIREAAMDANPFAYEVMADEVGRWYTDLSTSPSSPDPGQAEQYAIVDMDTAGRGVASVAVDVRLSGSDQWFRSDLGWGYPLVGTGHVRTVVKLPVGWGSASITGLQLAVEPPSVASTLTVRFVHVERFTGAQVLQVPVPKVAVVPEALAVTSS